MTTKLPTHSAYDPFSGPFRFNPNFETDPRLLQALTGRYRRLGRWARNSRWYVEGLLLPKVDGPGVRIVPLHGWRLDNPLLCAYLSRPLGDVVMKGPDDYIAVMRRIEAAAECWVELVLDVKGGRGVCRQVTVRPAGDDGHITWMPRIPFADLIRHVVGFVEEVQPAPRPRSLAAIAKEAAAVYNEAFDESPYGAKRAVAEHFGWRTTDENGAPLPWREDEKARARVRRVIDVARAEGHLA